MILISRNEIFDLLTIWCKSNTWLKNNNNNNTKYIIEYMLFMNRLGCNFYLCNYTLVGHKYLQIKLKNNGVFINIRITSANRKLLKPFITRVDEDI